jgi:hypothetical protein
MLDKLRKMQDSFDQLANDHNEIANSYKNKGQVFFPEYSYHEGKSLAYTLCANSLERLINEQSAKQAC